MAADQHTLPTIPLFPLRVPCPQGACDCGQAALQQEPQADQRILLLTREEEKRLLLRLEQVQTLAALRHLQQLMESQLGVQLTMAPGGSEVRTVRGLTIELAPQRGLCRKTQQSIPAAIRKSMERHPDIVYALLNEGSLFAGL